MCDVAQLQEGSSSWIWHVLGAKRNQSMASLHQRRKARWTATPSVAMATRLEYGEFLQSEQILGSRIMMLCVNILACRLKEASEFGVAPNYSSNGAEII
jgi:hypothetical protein